MMNIKFNAERNTITAAKNAGTQRRPRRMRCQCDNTANEQA